MNDNKNEPLHDYLMEKVVDIQEARNWVAFQNFAGGEIGPRHLFQFAGEAKGIELDATLLDGRAELALDQLLDRAGAGDIRLYGRKGLLVQDQGGESYYDQPGDMPELVPARFIATASWTEDEGGSLQGADGWYTSLTANLDDLMKWHPGVDRRNTDAVEPIGVAPAGPARMAGGPLAQSIALREAQCRNWIMMLAGSGHMPKNRDELWAQAQRKFPDGLSRRGFDRCWDAAAPDQWKRAGRKPRLPDDGGGPTHGG